MCLEFDVPDWWGCNGTLTGKREDIALRLSQPDMLYAGSTTNQ